jgi:S-(hydroxymethyl)glutathione dehydrogenase/alcohol dehydrogenase
MLCPERSLVKIRDDMPLDRASLLGCGSRRGSGPRSTGASAGRASSSSAAAAWASRSGARRRGRSSVDAGPRFDRPKLGATPHRRPWAIGRRSARPQRRSDFVFECIGLVPQLTPDRDDRVAGTGWSVSSPSAARLISAADVTAKKITGSYMGSNRFRFDMPKYIDFYLDGRLRLDEMISSRIPLDEVNGALDRMRNGAAARQVIVFE